MKGLVLDRALALGAHHDAVFRELQVRHRDRVLVVLPIIFVYLMYLFIGIGSLILRWCLFIHFNYLCVCALSIQSFFFLSF